LKSAYKQFAVHPNDRSHLRMAWLSMVYTTCCVAVVLDSFL
jgi:hypothetical protein